MKPGERSVCVSAMVTPPGASQSHSPASFSGDPQEGGPAALWPCSMGLGGEGERWPQEPETMAPAETLGTSTAPPILPSPGLPLGLGLGEG